MKPQHFFLKCQIALVFCITKEPIINETKRTELEDWKHVASELNEANFRDFKRNYRFPQYTEKANKHNLYQPPM